MGLNVGNDARFNAIRKQLRKHCIDTTDIYFHNFKGVDYYVIKMTNCTGFRGDIAKALDIKENQVHFIHSSPNHDYSLYWIERILLEEKYMNSCGELVFEDEFDFKGLEWKNKFETLSVIAERLKDHGVLIKDCGVSFKDGYLFIFLRKALGYNAEPERISIALGISNHCVSTVEMGKCYAVILDKV